MDCTLEATEMHSKVHRIHSDLRDLAKKTGYPIRYVNNYSQRIFGPAPDCRGETPEHGSEIFVSRLPKDAYEDELFNFFTRAGKIYTIRLMITPSQIHNKGFAFVTFFNPEEAQRCIKILRSVEFRQNCYLSIVKSLDNNRIFIGGVPDFKTKDQVWHELHRNGMYGITDIIMYRSYADRSKNRGFVFVEFRTHQEAAQVRVLFKDMLMWGERVHVDWSSPLPEVEPCVMSQVKKLFLRNLDVAQSKSALEKIIKELIADIHLERVYKFKNYAFVHFTTRRDAQKALHLLKELYKATDVEVTWAIPPKFKPRQKYRTSRTHINVRSCLKSFEDTSRDSPQFMGIDFDLQLQNWEDSFRNEEEIVENNIAQMIRHLSLDS